MTRLLLPLALAACGADPQPPAPTRPAPMIEQPTVLFVVLDTVRADHLSLCGYERETSPVLTALAQRPGGTHTCRAYAPGSWTLPSHASYFTGLPVDEHGAHAVRKSDGQDAGWDGIRPLGPEHPTLAEALVGRGYQAVMVSANPVLGEAGGLSRGFGVVHVAEGFGDLRGEVLRERLGRTLAEEVDPTRPLFLFVNLSEAHNPLENPPAGHAFADMARHPERRALRQRLTDWTLWQHPDPAAAIAWYTDLYDVGIQGADASLGVVLEEVRGAGWLAGAHRITVTSDHGEHLGAHGYFRHGGDVYEDNVRVPVVHVQVPAGPGRLPAPFPGVAVHGLVADGALPPELPRPVSFALPMGDKARRTEGRTGVLPDAATWSGDDKIRSRGGTWTAVDLARDPLERAPGAAPDFAPLHEELDRRLERARARPVDIDPEVLRMLQAAGYVDAPGE